MVKNIHDFEKEITELETINQKLTYEEQKCNTDVSSCLNSIAVNKREIGKLKEEKDKLTHDLDLKIKELLKKNRDISKEARSIKSRHYKITSEIESNKRRILYRQRKAENLKKEILAKIDKEKSPRIEVPKFTEDLKNIIVGGEEENNVIGTNTS